MRPRRTLLAGAVAFFVCPSPGAAQVSEDIIAAISGDYRILPVNGRTGCGIRLRRDVTIGGRSAIVDLACRKYVPQAADVSAWYPTDGVSFYDPIRRRRMRFEEDETTLLRSPSVMNPRYYLTPGGRDFTRAPTGRNVAGGWTLSRNGRASCHLTLVAAAVPDRDNHPLRWDAVCTLKGLPKGLLHWRLEELTLLIEGPNDAQIQLEAESDGVFHDPTDSWRLRRN